MVLVTFVLSCDLFWGYSMVLDPLWFTSIEALISCIKVTLCIMLKQNGLDVPVFHAASSPKRVTLALVRAHCGDGEV